MFECSDHGSALWSAGAGYLSKSGGKPRALQSSGRRHESAGIRCVVKARKSSATSPETGLAPADVWESVADGDTGLFASAFMLSRERAPRQFKRRTAAGCRPCWSRFKVPITWRALRHIAARLAPMRYIIACGILES
jgi:hypothetical protein